MVMKQRMLQSFNSTLISYVAKLQFYSIQCSLSKELVMLQSFNASHRSIEVDWELFKF
jgi:hypothetical protein